MRDRKALATVATGLAAIEELVGSAPAPADEDLRACLVGAGLAPRDAAALLVLLPLGFGRAFLQQKGVQRFGDHFRVGGEGGGSRRIRLSELPLYRAAVAVAVRAFHHGTATPHALRLLVGRSVEVRLLSKLLDAGKPLPAAPDITLGVTADPEGAFHRPPWWRRLVR